MNKINVSAIPCKNSHEILSHMIGNKASNSVANQTGMPN